ncbi:tetratricopeptide repeat protein [Comamonas granuli]|uniref:tetratricopeptide repeat protein n=1 Tax=Comamonas granuli TaxID=290309 RepID=UPI0012EBCBC4|nr:tetratricopeptide repeat protein [Comamonas granuli]
MLEDSDTSAPSTSATLSGLLAEAMQCHAQWRFDEARQLYEAILREQPEHPDANHNLGVLLAVQLLRPAASLPYFEAALNADPRRAQYWFSYLDALIKAESFDMAEQVLPLAQAQGLDEAKCRQLEQDLALARAGGAVVAAMPPAGSTDGQLRQAPPRGATGPRVQADPATRELQAAIALFNQKAYAKALASTKRLAQRYPSSGATWKLLGAIQQQLGHAQEALQAKRKAAHMLPLDPEAHCNLANTLVSEGLMEEALASFGRALELDDGYALAHFNQANALMEMGRMEDAEAGYRRAAALAPHWADVHSNLGFLLRKQGRLEEAAQSYRQALSIAPGDPVNLQNLGLVYSAQGQVEEALQCFKAAVAASPASADLQGAYGETLHAMGRLSAAETAFRRALQLQPDHPTALRRLGHLLQHQGRLKEAETCLRRCLAMQPDDVVILFEIGSNLAAQKRWDEALTVFRDAIARKPDFAEAHINLSQALYEKGDYERAAEEVKASLQVLPEVASLHSNLGVIHTMQGKVDEALGDFQRALELKPDFDFARSCMLYALSHSTDVDQEELTREHLLFGDRIAQRVGRFVRTSHANDRDPERTLRIGFVSADFRQHAVAKFFIPFIEAFAKRSDLICYAYYNHAARDIDTEAIERHFAVWRPVIGLSDERLAAQIEEDAIDILIDLSGHTAGNRLAMFGRKPAPVQVTWGGYPGTTGVRAIDYRLVEHGYMAPEVFQRQFVEKMVELPAVSAFHGLESMPDVNDAPVLANGFLTFGSFNRLSKVNREVIAAWCRVLRALPTSRLLMAGMPGVGTPAQILEWFEQEGIAADRLLFRPRTDFYNYLHLHREVDLCLDTFPYTGGTTTNHALWMGVPTLTVAGDTYPSRQSAMFLRRVGLERGFVLDSVDDMVEQSLYWARHAERLQQVRSRLRGHLLHIHSAQLDVVAAGLAQALRVMWRRWCTDAAVQNLRVEYEDIGIQRLPALMEEDA